MKKTAAILCLVLISLTSHASEFECNKVAADQALEFLSQNDDFPGDMAIGKMNHLSVIRAYTTYLEAQVETDPSKKLKLMEQAVQLCGARD